MSESSSAGASEDLGSPDEQGSRHIYVVFSGLALVMLLAALDSTIVATALPTIVGELGGFDHIGWVVTAYLLAQTIVTPLYGKLGDQYGRKIVLQVGLVVFLIGSILCGFAQNLPELIAFRAVQGPTTSAWL
jgi:MFS family permease